MKPRDTKTDILDAAERLFADKGFDGTAIREITRVANVNVAAIHYHYGTKEEVLRGVTDRIVGPLNSRRFELLDIALDNAQPHPPSIEAILDAFIRPDIETLQELHKRGPTVAHFLGRTYMDPTPWIQQMAQQQFAEAQTRFFPVLAATLGDLSFEEIGLAHVQGDGRAYPSLRHVARRRSDRYPGRRHVGSPDQIPGTGPSGAVAGVCNQGGFIRYVKTPDPREPALDSASTPVRTA